MALFTGQGAVLGGISRQLVEGNGYRLSGVARPASLPSRKARRESVKSPALWGCQQGQHCSNVLFKFGVAQVRIVNAQAIEPAHLGQ